MIWKQRKSLHQSYRRIRLPDTHEDVLCGALHSAPGKFLQTFPAWSSPSLTWQLKCRTNFQSLRHRSVHSHCMQLCPSTWGTSQVQTQS